MKFPLPTIEALVMSRFSALEKANPGLLNRGFVCETTTGIYDY
jgi:hypothetical protein